MKPIRSMSLVELCRLLTVLRDRDYRMYVLVLIAVSHGLRVTEVTRLTGLNFTDGRMSSSG